MALKAAMMAAVNATMRGVVYQGIPYQVSVVDLPIPTIQNETDALVRITTAGICGSDLHYYHGTFSHGSTPPWGMGHEAVGFVTDVGNGVNSLAIGDRVVIPDIVNDAHMHIGLTDTVASSFGTGSGLGGCQSMFTSKLFILAY